MEYLVPNTFILHSSLIQYLQILEIKCKNVGIIIHMDRGLDPPSPHVDKHGHFGNPPPPSAVHMVCRCPLIAEGIGGQKG